MIGRFTSRNRKGYADSAEPKSFDDFEMRLGDMMRGERATMGKSLLDVQRELRIKASYISGIENCDPTVFDTPGFIAGYVRSYARYLNMDPEFCFDAFCAESGFSVAHGMSAEASGRKPRGNALPVTGGLGKEGFLSPKTPFVPDNREVFGQIELRAVGSLVVLAAVIGGLAYGGWRVLREVQQVTFAPVEQTPDVLANLDPIAGPTETVAEGDEDERADVAALNRLYRPQALDVPVLVARDAPIASLNPQEIGNFAGSVLPSLQLAEALLPVADPSGAIDAAVSQALAGAATAAVQASVPAVAQGQQANPAVPQVVADVPPSVTIYALNRAWVQVKAEDGSVIFEKIMKSGETFDVPRTEGAYQFGTGESSGIYFEVNGQHYGPVGDRGKVTKRIALAPEALTERFARADLTTNERLAQMVAQLASDAQLPAE